MQIFFTGYMANCSSSADASGRLLPGLVERGKSGNIRKVWMTPTVLNAKSRGEIRLKSANPLDEPLIRPNYLSNPHDMASIGLRPDPILEPGCEHLAPGHTGDGTDDLLERPDEYWECVIRRNTNPENHQAGTCRMGASLLRSGDDPIAEQEGAVLDRRLRVRGVRRLRVADASALPTAPSSNINAAIVMVAEKLAYYVRGTWEEGWGLRQARKIGREKKVRMKLSSL
ncbi:hypothetical protein J437_LFUL015812 [Ladona fulva]|uniref:Glucose-methanol-choline oxidoreductase C-terminal domain-containing protein n=1 Tax=Ladona fulva TaxID=123851 RepID=A0A8K0P941_LADFU|nr:hypothetical protein J437_LFUL015812 [Ladona fulva]